MGDTEQTAIDALRAAGLEAEALAVEQLRGRHKETMDAYHAGQRASYQNGLSEMRAEIGPLRATLGIALVALEHHRDQTRPIGLSDEAIHALRLALGSEAHASDCATSNGPAYPVGPCDCGATPVANLSKVMQPKMLGPGHMTDAERMEATRRFRGD
jgi:hypothetical protein